MARHYRVTPADAFAAHDQALAFGGGRPGVSSLDNLLGALGRPYHGYHRSMASKAVALLHGVATSHGFLDGNKRTAWLLTFVLIERSGWTLDLAPDEPIDDVIVDLLERRTTVTDVRAWFAERLRRP